MLKEKLFDTGQGKINYAEGPPSGSPLVLLHGFSWNWRGLLPLMPHLLPHYHVYALDLRGHGKSDRFLGSYSLAIWMNDIATFLREKVSEPATVFGHSLGGMIALKLAAHNPSAIRAVAIGDSPLFWEGFQESDKKNQRIKATYANAERLKTKPTEEELFAELSSSNTDELGLRATIKSLLQLDPKAFEDIAAIFEDKAKYVSGYDLDTLLPQISCPVLLIQADPERNAAMMDQDVERAKSLIADVRHVKFSQANHALGVDTWEITPLIRTLMLFFQTV